MGIKVRGVGDVLAMFRAYQNDVPKKIKQARIIKARQILNDAKKAAPKVTGKLKNSGNVDNTTDQNSSKIYFDADYAPFLEFGTGGKVKIPAGFEELASQFGPKGAKEINIKPQPYLIPAFLKGSIEFQRECEQIIKQNT
jgi:hypothetical protein